MANQPIPHDCLIGLGSNLGDSRELLESAIQQLQQHPEVSVTAVSDWINTAPIGGAPSAPGYLNGAARLSTPLPAANLLQLLLQIESALGRQRVRRWSSRTVDLDLLIHGDTIVDDPDGVTVPHPWMGFRCFVLQPAAQIAGEMIHPQIQWSVNRLWKHAQRRPLVICLLGLGGLFDELAELVVRDASATVISLGAVSQEPAFRLSFQQDLMEKCETPLLVVDEWWHPSRDIMVPADASDPIAPNLSIHPLPIDEECRTMPGPFLYLPILEQETWLHQVRAAIAGLLG